MAMRRAWSAAAALCGPAIVSGSLIVCAVERASARTPPPVRFQTSDRCMACHNGLEDASGRDVSIGFDWRASIMANSSRDPYWQASVRRETLDHAPVRADIEDECAICHMPMPRYEAHAAGRRAAVFAHLPFTDEESSRHAKDGVSCSVCHQIGRERLGTAQSFNGGFVIDPPDRDGFSPEYGPYAIEGGQTRIMRSSTDGFRPLQNEWIQQSEVCATCHTLITEARSADGAVIGSLPEQVPYQEWLHSDFKDKQSCQSCHMPVVPEPTPIARVLGVARERVSRHVFVGANFFIQRMLNRYRDELAVDALPAELTAAADGTMRYLETAAAKISIDDVGASAGRLQAHVTVENLGGHKLPTAYPSRRAWIHFLVRGADGKTIFESGALNRDGSIAGNDNDADASRFEPHHREIRTSDDVQIYEPILGDSHGAVTTGLLFAVRYLKDNRLLPRGFDKRSASPEIAVQGEAADDPDFVAGADRVTYSVPIGSVGGPIEVEAELLYQPIGFRWATNLKSYGHAAEPHRFNAYYDAMSGAAAARLAHATRSLP
jgi:hypothetical protein